MCSRGHCLILLALVVLLAGGWAASPAYGDTQDFVPGQVVVKLAPTTDVDIGTINLEYGTSTLLGLLHDTDIFVLEVPAGQNPKDLAAEMASDARLLYAEVNYVNSTPQESNTDRTYAWGGQEDEPLNDQDLVDVLQLDAVHDINRGVGTVVAIIDTGVQLAHPALADRWTLLGYDFVDEDLVPEDEANGKDDDGDGQIDESYGHGTHVAGIVNVVAPDARLMALRVLNSDGRGNNVATARAVLHAIHNGADVINLSLGTPFRSALLRDVVEQAAQRGVVVVSAAGNLDTDTVQYPAAEACALGVTSVSFDDVKSSFANFGHWVDVAAPGESIYSPFPVDGYAWWSGTSMATPVVAGQAALLRSAAGDTLLHDIGALIDDDTWLHEIGRLIGGTVHPIDDIDPDYRDLLGAGRIDVLAGLEAQASGQVPESDADLFADCSG